MIRVACNRPMIIFRALRIKLVQFLEALCPRIGKAPTVGLKPTTTR
jgi:hypothetical protein